MTKQIHLTKGMSALVDDEDFDYLNQWKWRAAKQKNNTFYAIRDSFGKSILMHREISNPSSNMFVDHINHDGLDNRKINLRNCSNSENQMNRNKSVKNVAGFKGVSKKDGKYKSQISKDGVDYYLGCFDTPEEAARVYDAAAKRIHGVFAKTNF